MAALTDFQKKINDGRSHKNSLIIDALVGLLIKYANGNLFATKLFISFEEVLFLISEHEIRTVDWDQVSVYVIEYFKSQSIPVAVMDEVFVLPCLLELEVKFSILLKI